MYVYMYCMYVRKYTVAILLYISYSPTGTGGSHTASIKPAGNVPHQTAPSGVEYAMTTKATTTTKPQQQQQQQQPTEEYAVVDKSKKHAAATQGVSNMH